MLKVVEAVLTELCLISPKTELHYNINMGTSKVWSVGVFLDTGQFFMIKVSELYDLGGQYATQLAGWNQYQELVPRPLGYRVSGEWCMIVTQGVHHKPFPFQALNGRNRALPELNDLFRYFEISAHHEPVQDAIESHQTFFDKLENHFFGTQYAGLASYWVRQGRLLGVESLPNAAQHGDFVQNNLATSDNRLIIFDWEDFGTSLLPGLDICSLYVSMAPEVAAIRDLMTADRTIDRPMEGFVRRACAICGVDVELFRRLIPLYLLVFLYLKELGYGRPAQDRFGAYLRQLTP